jgi:uncharacterized protein YihD (DUF1040 family)
MREISRIPEVLRTIHEIWVRYPDLRLMQLIGNVFRGDSYYLEDDDFVTGLREAYGQDPTSTSSDAKQ